MIAITRDAAWAERLSDLAARGGWPFAASDVLPVSAGAGRHALIVMDRTVSGAAAGRSVSAVRGLFAPASVVLACAEIEMGGAALAESLSWGIDDVICKEWSDARLLARLSALHDNALVSAARLSADGTLKADPRARRVYVLSRRRWNEIRIPAAEFTLLWKLLTCEGDAVSREGLLQAMRENAGREVEAETVARRILSLRRSVSAWKGRIESVRGGFYRLVSARRRSTT